MRKANMKSRSETAAGLQELCRKLKLQLDELAATRDRQPPDPNDELRKRKLMEQLKRQLAELST